MADGWVGFGAAVRVVEPAVPALGVRPVFTASGSTSWVSEEATAAAIVRAASAGAGGVVADEAVEVGSWAVLATVAESSADSEGASVVGVALCA